MHIVFVNYHCYQLIDQHKTDYHACYGYYHVLRKRPYHAEYAGVPCAGCLADLPRNRPDLIIDIGEHGIKVIKHPPLQHLLYEISDFVYDAAHLSYENRLESCGITVCATMIMPPPLISCLIPCDFAYVR